MTGILLAPLYNTGILAKQAASLDVFSNGRLTLGLGVGWREDDFRAAPASFHDRGKRFDQQLELMARIWSGQPVEESGPIGPIPAQPAGPEVLFGGRSPATLRRIKRWGNGIIATNLRGTQRASELFRQTEESWQDAGRPGKPRLVLNAYFVFGPGGVSRAEAYLLETYAGLGPLAQQITRSVPSSPEAVRAAIQEYKDIGTDELVLYPCIAEMDQLHMLAEIACDF
jgi:alkanesulfonate monooxygenase SsuD/methylene tetrahydromethanopterin reductase-like flavin-dependent oxidoreductase (luciferase family)